MIKKTLTFENHDGAVVTETYHFHMNKAELAEMQLSKAEGLSDHLREILKTGDGGLIMSTFKGLMMQTVGKRSADGKLFRKTQEIRDEFEFSGAYSAMFMEMIADTNLALEFMKGIMPTDVTAKVDFTDLEKLVNEKDPNFSSEALAGALESFHVDEATQAVNSRRRPLESVPYEEPAPTGHIKGSMKMEEFYKRKALDEMSVEELREALKGRTDV